MDSYVVRRTVGTTTTTVCTTTTALTCTDTSQAKKTAATYAVVAKIGNWTSTSQTTTYTPDTTPPTITNLKLSHDNGVSSTDFITDIPDQTLSGVAEPGSQVTFSYSGWNATVTADGDGKFSISGTLEIGTYTISITAVDAAGNSTTITQAIILKPKSTPATEVIVPANTDTVMQDIDWQIPNSPNGQFCTTTTLTGATASPKAWQLLIRLDKAPYYGATASQVFYRGNSQVTISPVAGDPTLARVTGVSNPGNPWNSSWNNALLDSSKTLTITLCDSSPQAPKAGDTSWYAATTAKGTQNASQACVVLTVTPKVDEDDNPFYFGWQASVDLRAAKSYLTGLGKTINYVSWSPDSGGGYQFALSPTATNPVADTYTLTSGMMSAIKAGDPTTITACVNAY